MSRLTATKLIAEPGRSAGGSWIPAMDLHKIISELQSEKQRLDEAIQALERLSSNAGNAAVPVKTKRGRPPVQKQTSDSQKVQQPHPGQV